MEIDQLETFLAVISYGGFHRAAGALHVSQPAVSARIRSLEDSLGATLFERVRSRLLLSPAGKALGPMPNNFFAPSLRRGKRSMNSSRARAAHCASRVRFPFAPIFCRM